MRNRSAAIILRSGKILLMRRQKPGRDYYTLPGGGVHLEESEADACAREIKEETGLDVVTLHIFRRHVYQDNEDGYFLVRVGTGEPVLGGPEAARQSPDNLYSFRWANAEELHSLNLQPPAAHRICMEALEQNSEPEN